ncbi:molecular chaperone DnaJ [Rickettsiales bacterium LUAb2]
MSKDYYELLGVTKSSTPEEIKSAYRKLAVKYHPDRNKDDKDAESKFKEINEAYEVLKDPQKRAMYDQGGMNYNSGFGGAQGFGGFSSEGFGDIFGDIFNSFGDIFGSGNQRGRGPIQRRGNNLGYEIAISLEEAFNGVERSIKIKSFFQCDTCNGSGSKDNQEAATCKMCNGHGKVRHNRGFLTVEQTCSACSGTGNVIKNPCDTCKGDGRLRKEKVLAIKIPAGIANGMKIRLTKEGEAGFRGAEPGDLFVSVHVMPHKFYQQKDNDLYMIVSIPLVTAVLGDSINIPLIDGTNIDLKIPDGTQNGQRLRIKQKGMSILDKSSRGDLYVDVIVEIPTKLNKEQKELFSKYFIADKNKVNIINN